jgi:hypothetical protein
MRTYFITLAAALSLVGFVAASAAGTAGGGSSGGGASAGTGSSGGGGGSAHGGGGGGGGAHGAGSGHGGGHAGGGYRVVGYESAGLGRGGAASRDGHVARSNFVIGPRTGSAAAAKRVTERHMSPGRPHKPRQCYKLPGGCLGTDATMALSFCPPAADESGYRPPGCPEPIRSRALPAR